MTDWKARADLLRELIPYLTAQTAFTQIADLCERMARGELVEAPQCTHDPARKHYTASFCDACVGLKPSDPTPSERGHGHSDPSEAERAHCERVVRQLDETNPCYQTRDWVELLLCERAAVRSECDARIKALEAAAIRAVEEIRCSAGHDARDNLARIIGVVLTPPSGPTNNGWVNLLMREAQEKK